MPDWAILCPRSARVGGFRQIGRRRTPRLGGGRRPERRQFRNGASPYSVFGVRVPGALAMPGGTAAVAYHPPAGASARQTRLQTAAGTDRFPPPFFHRLAQPARPAGNQERPASRGPLRVDKRSFRNVPALAMRTSLAKFPLTLYGARNHIWSLVEVLNFQVFQ